MRNILVLTFLFSFIFCCDDKNTQLIIGAFELTDDSSMCDTNSTLNKKENLLMISNGCGINLVDVSNPQQPFLYETILDTKNIKLFFFDEAANLLITVNSNTDYSDNISFYDISEITIPLKKSEITNLDLVQSIYIKGNYIYIGFTYPAAITTVDLTNIENPMITNYQNFGNSLYLESFVIIDNYVFIYSHDYNTLFEILIMQYNNELKDFTYINEISNIDIDNYIDSNGKIGQMKVNQESIFYFHNGYLFIFNHNDPFNITLLSHIKISGFTNNIYVYAENVYLTAGSRIYIVDISDILNPYIQTHFSYNYNNFYNILIENDYAYFSSINNNLFIIINSF